MVLRNLSCVRLIWCCLDLPIGLISACGIGINEENSCADCGGTMGVISIEFLTAGCINSFLHFFAQLFNPTSLEFRLL